ncbi:hypothetical protein [Metamycoplasma neophronis]|uniref:DUF4199 domain-containing protein n=1 Tax=Metamycoplasma neophronis TaxID=872983 RepID=A0ABY2Z085_9BACT|nr:hypothetical protein [Metamycoplasma neophronis]TPR53364.1 hypothetical protein FJR74_02805 [Metamycoplasma neophronis]
MKDKTVFFDIKIKNIFKLFTFICWFAILFAFVAIILAALYNPEAKIITLAGYGICEALVAIYLVFYLINFFTAYRFRKDINSPKLFKVLLAFAIIIALTLAATIINALLFYSLSNSYTTTVANNGNIQSMKENIKIFKVELFISGSLLLISSITTSIVSQIILNKYSKTIKAKQVE